MVTTDWGQISSWFEDRARAVRAPSATLAIGHDDHLYSVTASGQPDSADREGDAAIGCLASVITAHAVLGLVASGALSLDDSVRQHIPAEYRSILEPHADVKIGHLLSHTSGLAAFPGDYDFSRWLAEGPDSPEASDVALVRIFSAGELFSYDPLNFALLGIVLHALTGLEWADAARELVLEPLGCAASFRVDDRPQGESSDGYDDYVAATSLNVSLSAEDLARYGAAHIASQDDPMRKIANQMRSSPAWAPRVGGTAIQGFAWRHMDGGSYGYAGVIPGASHTSITMHVERGMAVALQFHGPEERLFFETLPKFGLLAPLTSVMATARAPAPETPKAFEGVFRNVGQEFEMRYSEGRLALWSRHIDRGAVTSDSGPIALRQLGPRLFTGRGHIELPDRKTSFYLEYVSGEEAPSKFHYIRIRDQIFSSEFNGVSHNH